MRACKYPNIKHLPGPVLEGETECCVLGGVNNQDERAPKIKKKSGFVIWSVINVGNSDDGDLWCNDQNVIIVSYSQHHSAA